MTDAQRALSLVLVIVLLACAVAYVAVAIITHDPYGGVPACTDAIANARGICHGEP